MKNLGIALLVLLLQACAGMQPAPTATGLDAGTSEVVVIGKIELVPPLEKGEQKSHWNAAGEDRLFRVWIATGPEFKQVTAIEPWASEFQAGIEADWGKPFMVKMPRRRTFLNGGVTYLDVLGRTHLSFPGGVYFEVPPEANAVYIGTLRYHRNDFNTITRVEVVDERRDIPVVLKTGSPADVRTSLLKRLR